MRLIADGVVDRDGVDGLARRIGYTPRHLGRILTQELGAGPLALARARRAQTARVLIETTELAAADVAFAAGFASVRQFNDTIREVYACDADRAARPAGPGGTRDGPVDCMRLAVRTPFAGRDAARLPRAPRRAGRRGRRRRTYARTLRAAPRHRHRRARAGRPARRPARRRSCRRRSGSTDLRDLGRRRRARAPAARRRLRPGRGRRRASPATRVLGPLVRARPGLRVPGHVDGDEVAVRAVLGQQVTRGGGAHRRRTAAPSTVRRRPTRADPATGCTHLFPDAATLAELDPETLPMPRARGRALVALCAALADGDVPLDRGADRDDVRRRLLAMPGIGPWTADYIALRALGHPDVFLPTDIGIRDALRRLGRDPAAAARGSPRRWRPWRSYAQLHLWQTLIQQRTTPTTSKETLTCGP